MDENVPVSRFYPSFYIMPSSRLWVWSLLAILCTQFLLGCSWTGMTTEPDEATKVACGQQCLKNGEVCSEFFAKKNREQRLTFEQAKQNYWICLRKYPGFESSPNNPCVAPVPPPEEFDSCGPQLDDCLELCQTSLDELAELMRREGARSRKSPTVETLPIAPGAECVTARASLRIYLTQTLSSEPSS